MKKIISIFALLFIASLFQPVMAKNIKVEALSDFSTANPPATWKVRIVEGFVAENGYEVKPGSIFEGEITDVTDPQRLKRDASFKFVPVRFYDSSGNIYKIENNIVATYSVLNSVSAGEVAKSGAVMVGDKLLKGFVGPGVAIVQGAVKNKQGNRVKSSVVSLYESTPLSYYNKGKEMEIAKHTVFIMSFKTPAEEEDEKNAPPNYSYTVPAN